MKITVHRISTRYQQVQIEQALDVTGKVTVTTDLLDYHRARELAEAFRAAADELELKSERVA